MAKNVRINLLSSPRNVSTAFMYAWAQRPDTEVIDEPFYAYYLYFSGLNHPGNEEILSAQSTTAQTVIKNIIFKERKQNISFYKQMSHHLVGFDFSFLKQCYNILFIRNPRLIINSYAKVIPKITMQDIGIEKQIELFEYLKNPIVLDSTKFLKNPKHYLQKICELINIPFYAEMMSWKKGPKKEDGIWAKYWYKNVHQTTCFKKTESEKVVLNEAHETLAKQCEPLYLSLLEKSI